MDLGFSPMIPTETGQWVSEEFERLARVVEDYDDQLQLMWIPPEQRETPEEREKPYVIMDRITLHPVFFCGPLDTPVDILERLFNGDNKHGNVLDRLEARNNAAKALEMKAKLDDAEEKQELVAWIMKTEKNTIQLGKGRKFDDQMRRI